MSSAEQRSNLQHTAIVRQKPLMTMRQILLMNLGFFGIQYSFGMQQTAVNPVYEFLGADPGRPADPQPGRTDHRPAHPAAHRRPVGPDVEPAVGSPQAVLPHRRHRLQHLPVPVPVRHRGLDGRAAAVAARRQQQHRDGALPRVHRRQAAALPAGQGLPRPVASSPASASRSPTSRCSSSRSSSSAPRRPGSRTGWSGRSCSARSARSARSWSRCSTTPEIPPSRGGTRRAAGEAGRPRPGAARRSARRSATCRPSCASWRWSTSSSGTAWSATGSSSRCPSRKSVFPPTRQGKEDAVAWTGLVNGWYNIVTFSVAFSLVAFARRRGAKLVHCVCLLLAAVGLDDLRRRSRNKYLLFIPIIGLGIAWASIMGVPYIMAVRMIPSTRYGVYMGIINMMIVVPMLIQSLTFGCDLQERPRRQPQQRHPVRRRAARVWRG